MKTKGKRKLGLLFAGALVLVVLGWLRGRERLIAWVTPLAGRVARRQDRAASSEGSQATAGAAPQPSILQSLQRVAMGIQGRFGDAAGTPETNLLLTPPVQASSDAEPSADGAAHPADVPQTP